MGDGAPEGDFVLDQLVSGLLATPCIRRRLDQRYKSELQVIKEGLPELPERRLSAEGRSTDRAPPLTERSHTLGYPD